MSTANRTPLPSFLPPYSPTTTTTNGPSFRRAVKVVFLLLLLVQIHYLYQNFFPNKSKKALHGTRMTTPVSTTNSSSLNRFEEERGEPKANTTSPAIQKPLNSTKKHKSTHNQTLTPFRIELSDREYKGGWHDPPFVIEKYRLLFFSTAKVGCTHWHLLFMRMVYNRTYAPHQEDSVHAQAVNQLKLLRHYSVQQATHMMTSPDWTRAIFVRDPMERFVSAYLNKALGPQDFIYNHCCHGNATCRSRLKQSAEAAFPIMKQCTDQHWRPQSHRISHKYMQQVNFIGRMETMQQDTERLLRHIGAWEQYGTHSISTKTTTANSTYSSNFTQPRHAGQHHATGASSKLAQHITPKLYQQLLEYYRVDYDNPYFNFTPPNLSWLEQESSLQQHALSTKQLAV